jgi:hypothetical protein
MKVLETYSIVIEGRGYSGAKKDRYESTIAGMLHGLAMTKAGKILLHWIKNSGTQRDWVLIVPYENTEDAKNDYCNADAWDDLWPVQIGSRQIMATKVRFSPETFQCMSGCSRGKPVSNPMEVLVHELVHAQRHVSRVATHAKLSGALSLYDTDEEFYAVAFTNVWASNHSTGNVVANGLRANHTAHARLWSPDDDSEIWMTNRDNYRMMEKYCHSQPKLTREMADIPVKFNPFRTYYNGKARKAG